MNRRTLATPVRIPAEGTAPGAFTGAHAAVEIHPAPAHHGLQFQLQNAPPFPATIARLDTRPPHPALAAVPAHQRARHTTLAADPGSPPIFTVEHLLAALAGPGITDALVRTESSTTETFEVPILDGSAADFAAAVALAGIRDHDTPLEWILLPRPVEVTRGEGPGASVVRCDPCAPEDAAFVYHLKYDHPFLGEQSAAWRAADLAGFAASVAPARTFSLEAEARAAQAIGLFQGFTPRDLLVINDDGPIDNELRFPNEPAAHKLLDLVGDLALAANQLGGPIAMRVTAHRSGHALHHLAAQAIVRAVGGMGAVRGI